MRPKTRDLHQRILACAAKHGMSPIRFEIMCIQRGLRAIAQRREEMADDIARLALKAAVKSVRVEDDWLCVTLEHEWRPV